MMGVVCARNPGRRNLGMYSVDFSATQYFQGIGKRFELLTHNGHRRVGDLSYRTIRGFDDYLDYDAIVFWGDFQQNPIWGTKNFAPRYAKDRRCSISDSVKAWRQLFLLEGRANGHYPKFFSVGTCFLGWEAALKKAGLERAGYRDCLAGFDAIIPRDVLSTQSLRDLGLENVQQGFDCASLIARDSVDFQPQPYFAYAFGRTLDSYAARAVSNAVSQKLGLRAERIDWLLRPFARKNLSKRYAAAKDSLRRAEFLVTDTYHLAVNGLNLGCDVYCLGRRGGQVSDTCDELKKEVLMTMVGRSDHYLALTDEFQMIPHQVSTWISNMIVDGREGSPSAFQFMARSLRDSLDSFLTSPAPR